MTLGEYIKAYRRAHGESQRAFANRCGISNTNISFIERGINPKTGRPIAPDLATLRKLSIAMGVSVQDIISETDSFLIDLTPETVFADDTIPLIKIWSEKLNDEGKERLMEFAEMLVSNPKYKKK